MKYLISLIVVLTIALSYQFNTIKLLRQEVITTERSCKADLDYLKMQCRLLMSQCR